MDLGKTPGNAVVALSSLLLFFLGFSFLFHRDIMESIVSLLVAILLTVAMSYGNRTPLGGFILGVFTSVSFLLGNFVSFCVWEMTVAITVERDWSLDFLMEVLSVYGPGMLSAVLALASLGFFFGLLGYVFKHISLQVPIIHPHLFRDYWSSVHLLGKSDRREYSNLDRKLSTWSIRKKGWWGRFLEKITEAKPDLVFSLNRKEHKVSDFGRGRLFDLSTGRMIGDDFVDPSDLISKYRPSVLKVAETSLSPKGIRRLALEKLIARFLKWLIPSRAIWFVYLLLSGVLMVSVYYFWSMDLAVYPFYPGVDFQVVLSAGIASVGTLFFVWRWRRISKELFERRPDERILIFAVYVILALLYGFWFGVIVRPPGLPEDWAGSWPLWTVSFLSLSVLLGVGYLFIHRESEVVNTYFYDNRTASQVDRITPFKDPHDEPFWLKEGTAKAFWVLRFMYFWRYEITTMPHSDWERVEVWVDAEDGTIKWVVSDYHYRELWYKIKGDLSRLYVSFFINFHTPVPVVDGSEVKVISDIFNRTNRDLTRMVLTGKTSGLVESLRDGLKSHQEFWTKLHPGKWINSYGLPGVAASFCSMLPWTYWRYSNGLEEVEKYLGNPSSLPEDQPSLGR